MVEDNDIQFEEDMPQDRQFHIRSPKILGEPETPGVITFLLDTNVVKNEKQATTIILLGVVIFLVISGFIIRNTFTSPEELKIINKYGQEITFDQYIESISRGEEPLKR